MPRTDVPPPGQGKRSKRKAWRDNTDHAISVYSLAAEEIPETIDTEETMSQVLPFWDDAPQLQSQSQSPQLQQQMYTEEEAQELIEKAYQDGWQQGMEEGYKLGKDKVYKVQEEEEEARKAKNKTNEAAATYQDTQTTSCFDSRVNATPQTNAAVPKACTSTKTTLTTTTLPNFITTVTEHPESFSAASRSTTSSISPTSSLLNAQIVENIDLAAYNSSDVPARLGLKAAA
jgi:hypothetical protein